MEFLSNKPLLITDTILRDAHQSQAATRMTTADMLPALEMLDSIGYYSLECWGGATFDACMRFPERGPVGAAADHPPAREAHEAANAVPWPEYSGLQALC